MNYTEEIEAIESKIDELQSEKTKLILKKFQVVENGINKLLSESNIELRFDCDTESTYLVDILSGKRQEIFLPSSETN